MDRLTHIQMKAAADEAGDSRRFHTRTRNQPQV
jgi:hypothetical protein